MAYRANYALVNVSCHLAPTEDALTEASLREGTNALRIVRDESTDDSFAVNNVTVHWREPAGRSV